MGGLLIVGALLTSTLLWARLDNAFVWLVLFVTLGFALVGFADDYAKVSKGNHKGVPGKLRLAIGFAIAGVATYWAMYVHGLNDLDLAARGEDYDPLSARLAFPVFKDVLLNFGLMFVPFGMIVIVGSAVGRVDFTEYLDVHYVPGTGELLIFTAALFGGGLGFLWYNAPPAAVFMGDTGSLALGGALGAIAVATKHELVLAIVGGLFVVEALSVIIQVLYFKSTGKRVFLMAPIHHHYEKKGWAEPQIVIRFWIISLILAMSGLAALKVRGWREGFAQQ